VAGEAGVPFFSISGSEFVEMFVGVGASRVRDLFDQAKRNAPCIVFIDEIDAVGRQRGAGLGGSHDEREQTLNQILVEMDGFDTNTNVIVIAATNRPDVLDPALVRPGRFDRQVILDAPDVKGRIAVLKVHTKGKPLSDDVNLEVIAKQTPGFSGADLANVINEAAILAARRSKKKIGMSEIQDAVERVALGGPERRSRVMTEREKLLVSYHEAGHAVTAAGMPKSYPVQKVTIVPRGRAGGYTLYLPEEDSLRYTTASQFEAQLVFALGGRVAEEIVFGPSEITTGASNDITQVTRISRAMVTRYGMSQKLGPIAFGEKDELIFLGREISEQRNYGDEVAREIDTEVHRIVDMAHERAREILTTNRAVLNDMASALIEQETIDGDLLRELLGRVVPIKLPEGAVNGNGNGTKPLVDVTTPFDTQA
jgi:cell division protease FtsH